MTHDQPFSPVWLALPAAERARVWCLLAAITLRSTATLALHFTLACGVHANVASSLGHRSMFPFQHPAQQRLNPCERQPELRPSPVTFVPNPPFARPATHHPANPANGTATACSPELDGRW